MLIPTSRGTPRSAAWPLTAICTHPELFFEGWIKLNWNLSQLQHIKKKKKSVVSCIGKRQLLGSFCSHSLLGSPFYSWVSISGTETGQGCNQWLHTHLYGFQESAFQVSGRHSKVTINTEQVLLVLQASKIILHFNLLPSGPFNKSKALFCSRSFARTGSSNL